MRGASGRKIIGKNRVTGPSGTPSSLAATTYSSSQINLTWVNGDASSETRIYRGASLVHTAAAAATSYSNTGLSAGTAYSYTVKHYKSGTEGTASSASSATTLLTTPYGPSVGASGLQAPGSDIGAQFNVGWRVGDADAGTEIWIDGSLANTLPLHSSYTAGYFRSELLGPSATINGSDIFSLGSSHTFDIRHVKNGIYSAFLYGGSGTTIGMPSYGLLSIYGSTTINRPSTWNNSNNIIVVHQGGSPGEGNGGSGGSGGYCYVKWNVSWNSGSATMVVGAGGAAGAGGSGGESSATLPSSTIANGSYENYYGRYPANGGSGCYDGNGGGGGGAACGYGGPAGDGNTGQSCENGSAGGSGGRGAFIGNNWDNEYCCVVSNGGSGGNGSTGGSAGDGQVGGGGGGGGGLNGGAGNGGAGRVMLWWSP